MMLTREVLVIVPVSDDALSRIAAADRCLHVVDARSWFDVGSDMRQHRGINLFCDNLCAYLDGRPLTNVVDWADGY